MTWDKKAYAKKYREAHKEYFRLYKKEYYKTHKDYFDEYTKSNYSKYQTFFKSKKYKLSASKRIKIYYKNNPLKYKARYMLYNAISAGKILKKEFCEQCNSKLNIQGHHSDYTKPLEVIWLCRYCHRQKHCVY